MAHGQSSPPPQRPLSMRTQDTLASLYKRQSTLNQQIASTRLLLEQQQSENKQAMTLATARDRANGKLQRKLDRLKTTLPPDQPPVVVAPPQAHQRQKQQWAFLQEEHAQWQQKVDQQQKLLEAATEKTRQAHQQLVCLSHISQTTSTHKRYQDLATYHALLDSLRGVQDLYEDWIQDMTTRFNCDDALFVTQMQLLKDELQRHLDQDRAIQVKLQTHLRHLATLQHDGEE
ncbi:hypothetical protein [Absidia glauca]|uniref:Uncharacterized protein n=1 Tax=Absidia glauca TaxID=4829 RepID=A0A163KXX6_ABSGL|nr:hypothetical protein [Absidia glauca]